jgi:hypothetical protein
LQSVQSLEKDIINKPSEQPHDDVQATTQHQLAQATDDHQHASKDAMVSQIVTSTPNRFKRHEDQENAIKNLKVNPNL